jgi:hypothetical protein
MRNFIMKRVSRVLLTTMFAAGLAAGAPQVFAHPGGARHGGAHHASMHASRLDYLKAQLQITSKQQSAWNAFTQAMKKTFPQHQKGKHGTHQPEPLKPAPDVLSKWAKHMADRAQQAKARAQAMQTFYKSLTPVQRAIIDTHVADMAHHFHGHFHHR